LQKDEDTDGRKVVVTDTVFSMDGDRAPLRELAEICHRHGALLVADEAHAVGVLGPEGRGLAAAEGLDPEDDLLLMGTLGKAFGVAGAYVACSAKMRVYLINTCRSFIFSTAPPPALLAAVSESVEIVRAADTERERLRDYAIRLREKLSGLGVDTLGSTSQIVPALVGEAAETVEISEKLRLDKIFAPAVRPPTVPKGTSRIRFSLSAALGEDDFQKVIDALERTFSS
jgi:8-amino-7-oxononanoate synthase